MANIERKWIDHIITPSQLYETFDMITSAHFGYSAEFHLGLKPSAGEGICFDIYHNFIVSPFSYHVPGYRKRRRYIEPFKPWHLIKDDLTDNSENRLRNKMIDADIELSTNVIYDEFELLRDYLEVNGIKLKRSKFVLMAAGFIPFNVTTTIVKYILKLQVVYLIDIAAGSNREIVMGLLGFNVPKDDDERFQFINNSIAQNSKFIHNWKLEIEERRAIIHRIALSKNLDILEHR